MCEVKIVSWEERYHPSFISLSIEWLEEYVSVEPADLEILHHPHENVLDGGGEIFFALADGEAVGTVAMIRMEADTFELAKLAVTPRYKGRGIGKQLMERAIAFARRQGARHVILYTNHRLAPALHLYRKYGFEDAGLSDNKYLESDMKMRLRLR